MKINKTKIQLLALLLVGTFFLSSCASVFKDLNMPTGPFRSIYFTRADMVAQFMAEFEAMAGAGQPLLNIAKDMDALRITRTRDSYVQDMGVMGYSSRNNVYLWYTFVNPLGVIGNGENATYRYQIVSVVVSVNAQNGGRTIVTHFTGTIDRQTDFIGTEEIDPEVTAVPLVDGSGTGIAALEAITERLLPTPSPLETALPTATPGPEQTPEQAMQIVEVEPLTVEPQELTRPLVHEEIFPEIIDVPVLTDSVDQERVEFDVSQLPIFYARLTDREDVFVFYGTTNDDGEDEGEFHFFRYSGQRYELIYSNSRDINFFREGPPSTPSPMPEGWTVELTDIVPIFVTHKKEFNYPTPPPPTPDPSASPLPTPTPPPPPPTATPDPTPTPPAWHYAVTEVMFVFTYTPPIRETEDADQPPPTPVTPRYMDRNRELGPPQPASPGEAAEEMPIEESATIEGEPPIFPGELTTEQEAAETSRIWANEMVHVYMQALHEAAKAEFEYAERLQAESEAERDTAQKAWDDADKANNTAKENLSKADDNTREQLQKDANDAQAALTAAKTTLDTANKGLADANTVLAEAKKLLEETPEPLPVPGLTDEEFEWLLQYRRWLALKIAGEIGDETPEPEIGDVRPVATPGILTLQDLRGIAEAARRRVDIANNHAIEAMLDEQQKAHELAVAERSEATEALAAAQVAYAEAVMDSQRASREYRAARTAEQDAVAELARAQRALQIEETRLRSELAALPVAEREAAMERIRAAQLLPEFAGRMPHFTDEGDRKMDELHTAVDTALEKLRSAQARLRAAEDWRQSGEQAQYRASDNGEIAQQNFAAAVQKLKDSPAAPTFNSLTAATRVAMINARAEKIKEESRIEAELDAQGGIDTSWATEPEDDPGDKEIMQDMFDGQVPFVAPVSYRREAVFRAEALRYQISPLPYIWRIQQTMHINVQATFRFNTGFYFQAKNELVPPEEIAIHPIGDRVNYGFFLISTNWGLFLYDGRFGRFLSASTQLKGDDINSWKVIKGGGNAPDEDIYVTYINAVVESGTPDGAKTILLRGNNGTMRRVEIVANRSTQDEAFVKNRIMDASPILDAELSRMRAVNLSQLNTRIYHGRWGYNFVLFLLRRQYKLLAVGREQYAQRNFAAGMSLAPSATAMWDENSELLSMREMPFNDPEFMNPLRTAALTSLAAVGTPLIGGNRPGLGLSFSDVKTPSWELFSQTQKFANHVDDADMTQRTVTAQGRLLLYATQDGGLRLFNIAKLDEARNVLIGSQPPPNPNPNRTIAKNTEYLIPGYYLSGSYWYVFPTAVDKRDVVLIGVAHTGRTPLAVNDFQAPTPPPPPRDISDITADAPPPQPRPTPEQPDLGRTPMVEDLENASIYLMQLSASLPINPVQWVQQ